MLRAADLPAYLARFPGARSAATAPSCTRTPAARVRAGRRRPDGGDGGPGGAWLAGVPGTSEGFDEVLPIYGRDPDAAKWAPRPLR